MKRGIYFSFLAGAALLGAGAFASAACAQTNAGGASAPNSGAALSSPVVKAMLAELDRSKNQLRMDKTSRGLTTSSIG